MTSNKSTKPQRLSFLSRIRSRVANKPDPAESQPEKIPRKYNYLDPVYNKTITDDHGEPTREVRFVLGWYYNAKEQQPWSYSVTDAQRKVFEWIREGDLEILADDDGVVDEEGDGPTG